MGLYRMGPPEALILALSGKVMSRDFVETGTYRGDTADWAARYFDRVTTIELSPHYQAAAAVRFREQTRVRVLAGDSVTVLSNIVPPLRGPAIFWLDAHWSGLDTAGRESQCPLLGELAIINSSPFEHTVLVDDARLFCSPPPLPLRADQWPHLGATVSALLADGRRYVVLFEDVFVAVPAGMRIFLDEWLQEEATKARDEIRLKKWWKKIRS